MAYMSVHVHVCTVHACACTFDTLYVYYAMYLVFLIILC